MENSQQGIADSALMVIQQRSIKVRETLRFFLPINKILFARF